MFNRLYVHVPFCAGKCRYCAFISHKPTNAELVEYPELVLRELQLHPPGVEPLASIYFGGGTPSLLQPEQLARLLEKITSQMGILTNAEITLEINPGTVTSHSLKEYRDIGINRLSLGIQSFDNHFLKCLGRIHSVQQSRQAFMEARNAGFNNISIDLIHSLPGQNFNQWQSALINAIQLEPEHISIYGLSIEEGTPFATLYPEDSKELADEDLSADMFEFADTFLTGAGFEHYEIANYARPGYRSRHNSGYWQRDGYLGLGVAAHSFMRQGYGVRFSNPDSMAAYRQSLASNHLVRIDEQHLTESDAMAEYMFLGLRMAEGVNLAAFAREFGQSPESAFGTSMADLIKSGLITWNNNMLALTKRGMLLSNQVFIRFLP